MDEHGYTRRPTPTSPTSPHANCITREFRSKARQLQAEFEQTDDLLSDSLAYEFALQEAGFTSSAYDLIVLCNFLTNPDMTTAFEAEICELTRSLTPGGILLILGGVRPNYRSIYDTVDALALDSEFPKLKKVLSTTIPAQEDDSARRIVSEQIVSSLRQLQETAPSAFEAVRPDLDDAKNLNATEIKFPNFSAHAYKAEGNQSISARDRRRMLKRRASMAPRSDSLPGEPPA